MAPRHSASSGRIHGFVHHAREQPLSARWVCLAAAILASVLACASGASIGHYKTLGLDHTASEQEIKKAFRRLSLKHHPDKNPNDPKAKTRFERLTAAYDVLASVRPEVQRLNTSG